ncbi:MAG: type IV pilus assembly protein PilM [Planctomycetota bacterium]
MNWKRTINFGNNDVFGLDIGSTAVKIVALRKDDAGYSVTGAGITHIAASKNDDHQETNTVTAIRDCFLKARVRRKLAVCGVSGTEVAVRDFEFSSLSTDEIGAAVSLEASQVCPFNAADSAVDYHLMANGNDKTRGVLVAATNPLIANKVHLTKEARLKCILMDVDGLALLNCFNGLAAEGQESQSGRTIAILNVGGSHTTLAVMDNEGWPFIRDMTCAGNDIIRQIAAALDTPEETVKEALFGNSASPEPPLQDNFGKACQRLISDVTGTLRYYTAQGKSSNVDRLLVCGGFALAKGFVELLDSRLGIEAVLWNPFAGIRTDATKQCEDALAKAGPAMAIAAGLAMRSI